MHPQAAPRLGNLTLLEKPINIVTGNDFYTAKQVEYGKSANYLTRSLVMLTDVGLNTSISRINAKLEAYTAWNVASIEKRHALLIALAQDVWKTSPLAVQFGNGGYGWTRTTDPSIMSAVL